MIELTPYTAQSAKRFEEHTGAFTGSLLTPEETADAFAAKSGPGCRMSGVLAFIVLVAIALQFGLGAYAIYADQGGLFFLALCSFFLMFTVLIIWGIIRSRQQNQTWKRDVQKVMDFPTVLASAVEQPIGADLTLRFQQHVKQAVEVDTVQLQVVMIESARYTSGTSTYTDRREIVQDEDWRSGLTAGAGEPLQQEFTLSVPRSAHTLPTWSGGNNQIIWRVRLKVTYVEGTLPQELEMDYILRVLPG